MAGYDNEPEIRGILAMLDIDRSDLGLLFDLIDNDDSGSCSYKEFVSYLLKAQSQDMSGDTNGRYPCCVRARERQKLYIIRRKQ